MAAAPLLLYAQLLANGAQRVLLDDWPSALLAATMALRLAYALADSLRRRAFGDSFLLMTPEVLLGLALVVGAWLGLGPLLASYGRWIFLSWFGAAIFLMPLADIFALFFVPPSPLRLSSLLPRFGLQLFYLGGLVAFLEGLARPLPLSALLPSFFFSPSRALLLWPLGQAGYGFGAALALSLCGLWLYSLGNVGLRGTVLWLSLAGALAALALGLMGAQLPYPALALSLPTLLLCLAFWMAWHE